MSDGTDDDLGTAYVQPIPYAIEHVAKEDEPGLLRVGDQWIGRAFEGPMSVDIALRDAEVRLTLTLRNNFSDEKWRAARTVPAALAVHMSGPAAWMCCEVMGYHARCRYPIHTDAALNDRLFLALHGNAKRTLILYGLSGLEVRMVKKGVMVESFWAEVAATLMAYPLGADPAIVLPIYCETEQHLDAPKMFAKAMREHLEMYI